MNRLSPENIILDGSDLGQLRETVEDVFDILSIETPRQAAQGTIIFVGQLRHPDSEAIYETIAGRWLRLGYTPLLSHRMPPLVALEARPGIIQPIPSNPWINLWLAVATIISVWFTGAAYECGCIPTNLLQWAAGLPMMLTMMVILAAHEFGHYFAAKYHKVAVTLPYFLPVPLISPVGTMGAFIQLRSAFKTRKQLFDIGVAGPLAGLVFAVPLIFWGVAQSQVHPLTRTEGASVLEGNSIFYLGVKYLVHGQLLPSFEAYAHLPGWQEFLLLLAGALPAGGGDDVLINSVAFAAWFGLFVTAMNLLPVGQFDGGHLVYCLLGGKKAYRLGLVLMAVMVVAGIFWWNGWLVWALLAFFVVGPNHPPPLNDLVPLGTGRKMLAYFTIIIFIIMFMPNPLQPL